MIKLWFVVSFSICVFFVWKTIVRCKKLNTVQYRSSYQKPHYTTNCVSFKDIKSFVNSPLFASYSYDDRERVVNDYLYRESRSIYDCLLYRNKSKCFTFNDKGSIYASKVYQQSDMIMKYPHHYDLLINNPNACSNDTYVIIGSPSGPRQFVERVATRETWGGINNVNGKSIRHLFFVGQDENDEENDRMLCEENDKHHDIIQFNMRNHFMNLTLLSILTYNWTSIYCPNIAYYIRSDNDMFYNPRLHISTFLMKRRSNTLIGTIITGSKPIRVDKSRYWMPKSIFPRSMYDSFPSGCFVTIAGDTLRTIVETSERIGQIIYFDDVFLGQIAREANITLLSYPGNTLYFFNQAFNPKIYARMSAAHRYSPIDLMALWQIVDR